MVIYINSDKKGVYCSSFLQAGLGGLSFDEGQFSVFGYSTKTWETSPTVAWYDDNIYYFD